MESFDTAMHALRSGFYILVDGKPQAEPDPIKWAHWMADLKNKVVKQDHFGEVMVSTVFLGIDHNFWNAGDPILWETMIFGGDHDGYQERYYSAAQAIEGHSEACKLMENCTK